jgi:hypothetical protein
MSERTALALLLALPPSSAAGRVLKYSNDWKMKVRSTCTGWAQNAHSLAAAAAGCWVNAVYS